VYSPEGEAGEDQLPGQPGDGLPRPSRDLLVAERVFLAHALVKVIEHLGHRTSSQQDDILNYHGPLPEAGPKSTGSVASSQEEGEA
jgi:hypothetical protein